MPYLYCQQHGQQQEASTIARQDELRMEDESVLIVSGTLISGSWLCDSCNAQLGKGDRATLVSAFPSHCRDDLYHYDFGYERQYFAMTGSDTATAYGADWPDDSFRKRRMTGRGQARPRREPLWALDLRPPKTAG